MSAKCFRMVLRYYSLIHDRAYINGRWVAGANSTTFDVLNPANEKVIATVPNMEVCDVEDAIEAAHCAFPKWSSFTAKRRGVLLRNWYTLMEDNADKLANIVTLESGKSITEAKDEIAYGNSFIDWFAEEGRRVYGEVLQNPVKTNDIIVLKEPVGVAALIIPWNFPHAMFTRKVSAALAAGCTCVIKPAEDTPLTSLALCDLAEQADIPDGIINVVTCDRSRAAEVGKELCENPLTKVLSFTGSTEIGKLLYQQCAKGIKRVGLELGGSAAFIVFGSADINDAVNGAIAAKFRNNGQACISVNKFLIEDSVFDIFIEKLEKRLARLKLGNGIYDATDLGPLINERQLENIQRLIEDAVSKGATVVYGGSPATEIGKLFFQPTLLTDITCDMLCFEEEIFGPIAPCIPFDTEDEAIQITNNTKSGLAGYLYSNDQFQVWRVAKKLEVGMLGINTSSLSLAEAPFGGIKESGIGREGSHHGINEFINIKYLSIGNKECN